MGMIATSSNSFEVQQLRVHENRCFIIDPHFAYIDNPVYQYPFLQFAEATLAVNISGMAIQFMDLCKSLFAERAQDKGSGTGRGIMALNCLQKAQKKQAACRQSFYSVIEKKKNLHSLKAEVEYEPTVSVSTKLLNSSSGDGGKVIIKVRDNGVGILQKVLDKIYQPFFTTKPTGQGTGLGLSLSYDIIKAH